MASNRSSPPAPEFNFLVTGGANDYMYKYATYRQTVDKIAELRRRAQPTAEALAQLRELEASLAQQTRGRGELRPPEEVIAEKHPAWPRSTGRVLVAKRLPDNSLRYVLFPSVAKVLAQVESTIVLHDPRRRNVPYCTQSLYPMTEADPASLCSCYFDLEEEFEQPAEPWDVPTDEQLVPPPPHTAAAPAPGAVAADQAPRPLTEEQRLLAVAAAREAVTNAWRRREAAFAMRCRWAVALVKQAICARYGADLSEAPIYWYSACSRFKNSFRVYVPDWLFENVAELGRLMHEVARPMLDGLHEQHPCKKALRRAERCRPSAGNPYIVDWSVYNPHRQLRGPFQPKAPGVDNAFVPYDGTACERLEVPAELVRRYFEPALLCVAATRNRSHGYKPLCYHLRPYAPLGAARAEAHTALVAEVLERTARAPRADAQHNSLGWLLRHVERCAALGRNPTELRERLGTVGAYAYVNCLWVKRLAAPQQSQLPIGTERKQALQRALLLSLAAQFVRYALCVVPDAIDFGHALSDPGVRALFEGTADGVPPAPGLARVFMRALAYHMPYAGSMLVPQVPWEELEAPLVGAEECAPGRYAMLFWSHMFSSPGAMAKRQSYGTRGALSAYEHGDLTREDVVRMWQACSAAAMRGRKRDRAHEAPPAGAPPKMLFTLAVAEQRGAPARPPTRPLYAV